MKTKHTFTRSVITFRARDIAVIETAHGDSAANARLITAAPDLLAALHSQTALVVSAMPEGVITFPKWFGIYLGESLDASRDAITKATGNG